MGTPAIKHAADSLAAGVKAGAKEAKKLSESVKNQAKNLVNSKTISQRGMSHVFEGHVTGVPKKGTSIFNKNINVKELIRDTLTDSGSKISINTGNRSGFVFEKRYAQIIGYTGNKELHTLRVVIDEKGELVTAFPVKEYAK
ncbi:MAG: hypothetical protein ABF709_09465 [Leuconostoc pseudomesenteroides]|uniref:hypothetical protein n=1 Tax=Leuconostoc pseudomesenteroides TaxID=33968 RepID=UPI0039E90ADA